MDENAFCGGVIAGLACLIAGVHLIRLSYRSLNPPADP